MKTLKLLYLTLITSLLLSSCVVVNDFNSSNYIPLEEAVEGYELWYVDYHRSDARIPFLNKAFTLSFVNGDLFANNNIVDVGKSGNGFGILVGNYDTYSGVLETYHNLDGYYDFEVVQISANEIRLDDLNSNASYYLIGYQRNDFDYDMLFYDNIEFFLQEYVAWERTGAENGVENPFDEERYLQFTPENNTTFYSSHNDFGINIDRIRWDFVGSYIVNDINGYDDLKHLKLRYDNGDVEEFELRVINDGQIELYHIDSQTIYVFSGRGFVQYMKGTVKTSTKIKNSNRERTKIIRQKIDRQRHLK